MPLSAGVVLMVLMAIAFLGGLFFVTFYLQNVHGMSPVDAGLHLLPLTGMMIVGSPLAGALITKVGPRIPLAGGMTLTAVVHVRHVHAGHRHQQPGHVGLVRAVSASASRRSWSAPPRSSSATRPMELSGVAGGLQQAAMQIGGSLGTAVLGAVMASKVDNDLAGNWAAAKLPPLTPDQLAQASEAVRGGGAPVPEGTPAGIAARITGVAHDTFISGMSLACLVAAGVALVAVFVATLTKRGVNADAAGAGAGHI